MPPFPDLRSILRNYVPVRDEIIMIQIAHISRFARDMRTGRSNFYKDGAQEMQMIKIKRDKG